MSFLKKINQNSALNYLAGTVQTIVQTGGGGQDLTNYYTKTEIDQLLQNHYTKTESDTQFLDQWTYANVIVPQLDVNAANFIKLSKQGVLGFSITIGDVPSSVESFTSQFNVLTNVVYYNTSSGAGHYEITLDGNIREQYLGTGTVYLICQYRSNRTFVHGSDNDVFTPVTMRINNNSFVIMTEEQFTGTQSLVIDGLIKVF